MVLLVQFGVSEGTLFLLGNHGFVHHPRSVPGTVVHLDYEKHGNDALHGCDHGVSGLKPLKYRYGGDVFILSLIVSLLPSVFSEVDVGVYHRCSSLQE